MRGQIASVFRFLRHAAGTNPAGEQDDTSLLEQFVRDRSEGAFAALLHRHGPLVFAICRRVLREYTDAEDAFQATFLVLARKASSIRKPETLPAWLHRVALNISRTIKVAAARRQAHERQVTDMAQATPLDGVELRDWQSVLQEEVDQLPEKYRVPVVLCYLQGLTHEEAARRLGWPLGSVKGRLARAREHLRTRLDRRGLTLTGAALTTALADNASAAVPPALLGLTLRAALSFAAGGAAISARAVTLAKGAVQTMNVNKLIQATLVCLTVGLLGVGFGAGFWPETTTSTPARQSHEAPAKVGPAEEAAFQVVAKPEKKDDGMNESEPLRVKPPAPKEAGNAVGQEKDKAALWPPRVLGSAEVPLPDRIVQSDIVVVGRVAALEPKDVEAVLPYKLDYRIAVVKVQEVIHGQKDVKELRLGFISPDQARKVLKAGKAMPMLSPAEFWRVTVGQEGMLFLRKHQQGNFYVNFAFIGGFLSSDDTPELTKNLENARRLEKVLKLPLDALKAENESNRFLAATMLVTGYRLSWLKDRKLPEKAIDADESKLILKTLAEADWSDDTEALCPSKYPSHPYQVFLQLGVTKADGYDPPIKAPDSRDILRYTQNWLRDNQEKYRIQRFTSSK
jgi:RNA polymerase sigma factor (sigma-70 family)